MVDARCRQRNDERLVDRSWQLADEPSDDELPFVSKRQRSRSVQELNELQHPRQAAVVVCSAVGGLRVEFVSTTLRMAPVRRNRSNGTRLDLTLPSVKGGSLTEDVSSRHTFNLAGLTHVCVRAYAFYV